jgi:hypothetical protein
MSGTSRVLMSRGPLLVVGLLVAACSGTPAVATPTPTLPPGVTPQPTQPGGATTQPTIAPGQPTPPGGGGGGVFPDGSWQAGAAHVVITGDFNTTADLQLTQFLSNSSQGTTLLQYTSDTAQVFLTISLDATSVSAVVTTSEFVGGAGTTTDSPCGLTWSRQEANAIGATLACPAALVISTGGVGAKTVNLQAQFTATR